MSEQHYDVIGDVHGHADALRRLLVTLGYAESQGIFQHDTRKGIFVGDFVDRGPEQREVLRIARNMCEAGTAHAVLGNHELNAIAWATSNGEGGYLRKRSEKNASQHLEFLRQLDEGSQEYQNAIAWFRQLPVWLEFPGLRVVHACWHERSRSNLKPYLDSRNCLTEDGLQEAHRHGSTAHLAAEVLMKGPEQRLPLGMSFLDKGGHKRQDGTLVRQHSGELPSEWTRGLKSCRTSNSRLTLGIWKEPRSYSGIIGWKVNRRSHIRQWPAWTSVSPRMAT